MPSLTQVFLDEVLDAFERRIARDRAMQNMTFSVDRLAEHAKTTSRVVVETMRARGWQRVRSGHYGGETWTIRRTR